MNDIKLILDSLRRNLDNPEYLSSALTALSSALYYHNTQMSEAELNEKKAVIRCLNSETVAGKRMSVTEAEKRGVVETDNEYGKLKAQGEAVIEAINAIKMRIKVLSWERDNQRKEI